MLTHILSVELMSPAFPYDKRGEVEEGWKHKIVSCLNLLRGEPFNGLTGAKQVHVALDTPLNVELVRNIAEAILIYKPQFEQLAADSARLGDGEVTANGLRIGGTDYKNPSPKEIKEHLRPLVTIKQIAEALCPKKGAHDNMMTPCYCFWDLWPLVDLNPDEGSRSRSRSRGFSVKKKGAVVFRIPLVLEEDLSPTVKWIDFANLFVLAATEATGTPNYDPQQRLSEVIKRQGKSSGVPESDLGRLIGKLEALQ